MISNNPPITALYVGKKGSLIPKG